MKKLAIGALALTLATGLTVVTSAPALAGDPASQAARFLNKQLDGSLVHNDEFDFDDYGLSIDVGFALNEMDQQKNARKVAKAVAAHINSYTTGADAMSSDIYAGATAKAAAFTLATGGDATDVGGVNLLKRLSKRVAKSGPIRGRIEDKGATDNANVVGQSFAVQALLLGSPSKQGLEALGFLLAQQCKAGYFRLDFTPDKTAKNQTCDGGKKKTTSAPDTDTTALVVLSLLELPTPRGKVVIRAINKATAWLAKTQAQDGSWGGGTATVPANGNSTAWPREPSARSARAAAASQAADYLLRKLSVYGVSGENGAIAYDKAALKTAKDGISVEERDQFIRTSAQAAPALLYVVVNGCDYGHRIGAVDPPRAVVCRAHNSIHHHARGGGSRSDSGADPQP